MRRSLALRLAHAGPMAEIVAFRRSVREFGPGGVSEPVLARVVQLTQRAPSSFNVQPWRVILVRDATAREHLSAAMTGGGNVQRVRDAPAVAVFLADLEASRLTPKLLEISEAAGMPSKQLKMLPSMVHFFSGEGVVATRAKQIAGHLLSPLRPMPKVSLAESWAFKNTMIAAGYYMLAASSEGLVTAPMEGFDADRVSRALKIPPRFGVPVIIPTGQPPSDFMEGAPTPRYDLRNMVYEDSFGEAASFGESEK